MTDFFYSIDLAVFYFFNHTLSTPFLNRFFSILTDVNHWFITYILLVLLMWLKGGKKGKLAVIFAILLIIFSDQTGNKILKEIFERIRPCNALSDVITPLGCNGTYSFPSSHALNNFAIAVFFFRLYPEYKIPLFIAASLVALSRVYLGLHYPSDIIGGALIGSLLGYLMSLVFLKLEPLPFNKKMFGDSRKSNTPDSSVR